MPNNHLCSHEAHGSTARSAPIETTELRWFRNGPLPRSVCSWFTSNGAFGAVEERHDRYLIDGRLDRGLKLRDGSTLELKVRQTIARTVPSSDGSTLEPHSKHDEAQPDDVASHDSTASRGQTCADSNQARQHRGRARMLPKSQTVSNRPRSARTRAPHPLENVRARARVHRAAVPAQGLLNRRPARLQGSHGGCRSAGHSRWQADAPAIRRSPTLPWAR